MKRIVQIATLSLMFVLAGMSANAQTHGRMMATIPFDFYARDQAFAAGDYIIESGDPRSDGANIIIRSATQKTQSILLLQPIDVTATAGQPILVFNHYGSSYFLSEIRNPRDGFGAGVPRSKQEKNLAKKAVATQTTVALTQPVSKN